jgi:hypothetical protein
LSDGDYQDALETLGLWPFMTERGALYGPLPINTLSEGQKQLISPSGAIYDEGFGSGTVLRVEREFYF